jgi:alkanesulfonate monooxygenase SsuD/methylene tetrahydromethanopterin reductase-like flavin-dependent oxidoreductase (luciferase family)
MRFDMRAPGRTPAEIADLYTAAIEMSAWGEEHGCAAIIISEHHASEDGYLPSPLMLAASIAAVTKTTSIVIAAALLPLYDPVRLAEDMIVLDQLSRGRVMHVLGIGYRPEEYELYGVDFGRRGAIADEKLTKLIGLLRGASSDAPTITPAPFTNGGPMLCWGGGTAVAARRAGSFGLGFFAQGDAPGLHEAYETAARAAGHEPGMCMLPHRDTPTSVFVHPDVDTGWAEVGPAMLRDASMYAQWNEAVGHATSTASLSSARTVEELRAGNRAYRVVTPSEVGDLIATFGMVGLQPLCGGLDPDVAWTYLRRVPDAVAAASR